MRFLGWSMVKGRAIYSPVGQWVTGCGVGIA